MVKILDLRSKFSLSHLPTVYDIGQGTALVFLNVARQFTILPVSGGRITELVNKRTSPWESGINMFTTSVPCGHVLRTGGHVWVAHMPTCSRQLFMWCEHVYMEVCGRARAQGIY